MTLRVSVDRDFCIGSANCVRIARGAFELDEHEISVPVDPAAATEEQLRQAARTCPVSAITVDEEETPA